MTDHGDVPPPEEPTAAPPPGEPEEPADPPWSDPTLPKPPPRTPAPLPAPPPPGSPAGEGAAVPPRAQPPRTPPPGYLPPPAPRPRSQLSPIEAAASEARSGPPPWVWAVAGAAVAAVIVLVLVLVLRSGGGGGPLVIGTDVTLDATQESGAGCTTIEHFTAHGSLSGAGTIVYRFERSDGQSTGDTRLDVSGNSGFAVTEDWRFVGVHQGGGTMVFRIVSPTTREVRRDVAVSCP